MKPGILFRRDYKANLEANPPQEAEIVYAVDTEEFGVLSGSSILWRPHIQDITTPTTRKKFEFIATDGQTVFTGSDINGKTLSVNTDISYTDVNLSGILLMTSDYTINDSGTITLDTPALINSELIIITQGVQ